MTIEWVSKDNYCEASGFSAGRVRGWIGRHWTEGLQYCIHGKTTAINVAEVDKWWSNGGPQASGQEVMESDSGAGKAIGVSTPSNSRATHTRRLISPARLKGATG
tara:strand:+ start:2518 stop:2832 length:315 start_codon:yes stop_codon:yes gene_type:complete